MLQAAREDGTVQIRVTAQLSQCVELERKLERQYKLERAVVIPKPQDDFKVEAIIGAATGALLEGELSDGMTVGLGWGRTLSASLSHISPRTFKQDVCRLADRGTRSRRPVQPLGIRLALRGPARGRMYMTGRALLCAELAFPRGAIAAPRHQ